MSRADVTATLIGVGNPERGDDAVGLEIAARLRERRLPGVEIFETSGDGAALMELLKGRPRVFLFDAVRSGEPSGTVFRFDVGTQPLPATVAQASTHAFGVAEAIELARVVGSLPPTVILYGVEGACFELGAGLSPEVRAAVHEVVRRVLAELGL